jgi:mono/diheme cytochrome c family protein
MNMRTMMTVLAVGAGLAMLATRASAEDGPAVFKAQCAKCHGETGESDTSAGKTLKVPQLKGDAKVAAMSVGDIVKAAKDNEKHKSFIKKLTDEQITAAAGVVKQIAGGK